MERVQKIIRHPAFKKSMRMIEALEKERIFCGHDMKHLLDVSRIAWIETLEQSLDYPKDVIYGAGLLHDVGKYLQYTEGTGHHVASADIGREILDDAGYTPEETGRNLPGDFEPPESESCRKNSAWKDSLPGG